VSCGYEIAIVTGKQCELQIENSDWKTLCGAGDELVNKVLASRTPALVHSLPTELVVGLKHAACGYEGIRSSLPNKALSLSLSLSLSFSLSLC